MKLSIRQKYAFSERLKREALFFGVPMVCLELIGIPLIGWVTVLVIAVPATFVGLLITTTIEHYLFSVITKRNLL